VARCDKLDSFEGFHSPRVHPHGAVGEFSLLKSLVLPAKAWRMLECVPCHQPSQCSKRPPGFRLRTTTPITARCAALTPRESLFDCRPAIALSHVPCLLVINQAPGGPHPAGAQHRRWGPATGKRVLHGRTRTAFALQPIAVAAACPGGRGVDAGGISDDRDNAIMMPVGSSANLNVGGFDVDTPAGVASVLPPGLGDNGDDGDDVALVRAWRVVDRGDALYDHPSWRDVWGEDLCTRRPGPVAWAALGWSMAWSQLHCTVHGTAGRVVGWGGQCTLRDSSVTLP
jgi:hypothetical protein